MSCVASDRFRCPSLNVFFSDSLHQVIFFRPEMYIKKDLSFKWCDLLNDISAFIFHSNVHLLSNTFWHMLIYIYMSNLHILLNEWIWAVPEHQFFEVMHTITCSFQIVASSRFQFLLCLNVVFWRSHLRWGLGFIFVGLIFLSFLNFSLFFFLFFFLCWGGGVWSNLPFSVEYTWTLSTFKPPPKTSFWLLAV